MRTYFVAPQLVFAPFLAELLESAGLSVVRTDRRLDIRALEALAPEVVVLDTSDPAYDYVAISVIVKHLLPDATILAWADTQTRLAQDLEREGVLVISYQLEPEEAIERIRRRFSRR